jgi:tRNA pseudouridine38-40 synthase
MIVGKTMKKIRLLIEYDGTAYHGWQVQKDAITIQGIIEDRVLKITGERSSLLGAGRTDAGVHAFGQVAVFSTESELEPETLKKALNAVLPLDIRVLEASVASDLFHPRKDAIKKNYFYIITNQRNSSVFFSRYSWLVPQSLDLDAMKEASRVLVGKHDFSSFMGTGSDVKDFVRELYSLAIERLDSIDFMTSCQRGSFIKIGMEADGFLRHMVRNIVGTLIEIGRGRMPADKMKEILLSHDRRCAGRTAPAKGLFLERITY